MPLGLPHSAFLTWDDDDQDKALAWRLEQAARCGRCRTRRDEWDPARGGDRDAYVSDVSRCPGCERLDHAARDLRGHEDTHGLQIGLVPNDDHDHDDDGDGEGA